MSRSEFSELVRKALGPVYLQWSERLKAAYYISKRIHEKQRRDDGKRYFEHCRGVAEILIQYPPRLYGDDPTFPSNQAELVEEIIIALLHDTVEDAYPPDYLLKQLFGSHIAYCVARLSKVSVYEAEAWEIVKWEKPPDEYFESITNGSPSVRRVKLADRLHNFRDMGVWKPTRKRRKIDETRKYILQPAFIDTDERLTKLIEEACNEIEKSLPDGV